MQKRGFLLVVRGLPGCGKTTVVDEVLKLPSFSRALRLDPDRVDVSCSEFVSFCETFRSRSPNLPLKKKIYRYLLRKACNGLTRRRMVIWEQPWRDRDCLLLTIENIAIIAYRISGLVDLSKLPFSVGIVEISIKEKDARRRIGARFQEGRHSLTVKDFAEFIGTLEPFDNLGFPFACFDATRPISELALEIEKFVKEIQKGSEI